jgi:O-antigen/teichoic acid export membrane protein
MISKIISTPVFKEILRFSPTKIISIIVGILSFKSYTEFFSTEEYGLYNLIISTFSLITVCLTEWIGYVLIRYFEKHKQEGTLNEFLSTILTVLVLILIAVFIVGIFVLLILLNASVLFLLAFLTLPLTMIISLLTKYYQLDQQVNRYNLLNISGSLGVFVLFYLIYKFTDLRLSSVFLSALIINVGILRLAFLDFREKRLRFHINKGLLIQYLRYGLPLIGTGIGIVLLSSTSRYFIQYFKGSDAVGVFSAAFKIGELSIFLPLSIFTSIFEPFVFRELELNGKESAYASILKYKILYILFFGPVSIVFFIFPELPMILLGKNFESSLPIIPIVCLGNFIFGYAQFLSLYSQIEFKPIVITVGIISSALLNIILNYFLIPSFGIFGAAYSILISYLFYIIIINITLKVKSIPYYSFLSLGITALVFYKLFYLLPITGSTIWVKISLGFSIWLFLSFLMFFTKKLKTSNKL